MRQFDIIGAGMGTRETRPGEAAQALVSAEMVFATERLAEICENAQICLFSELAERAIACGADRAALLVSGDVGFFSAAGKLREKLLAHGEVRLFCGLSSMQYLCAKIGISYENACIRSLHGRKGDLLGAVSYHEKTFALAGGDNNVQFVCRSLADARTRRRAGIHWRKSRLTRRKSVEGNGIGACRNPLRRSCRDACPQSEFCKSV